MTRVEDDRVDGSGGAAVQPASQATHLVSVVVPIYRVEEYLQKCVRSLLGQTYSNLEIILVDDGSPDRCGAMCDQFASADERIHVIHKANGGLSSARNAGLDYSTGDFVTFVDSDDWVHPDYIRVLHDCLLRDGGDIACCRWRRVHENTAEPEELEEKVPGSRVVESRSALRLMLQQDESCETSACAKLFKAILFADLRFPEHVRFAEDLATTYRVLFKSRRVVLCDAPYYCYFLRSSGLEGSPFSDSRLDLIDVVNEMYVAILTVWPELKSAAACRRLSAYFSVLVRLPRGECVSTRKKLWRVVRQQRLRVLFDGEARFKLRVAAATSFLGHGFVAAAYRFFGSVRRSA